MANQEQLARLQEDVWEWNEWRYKNPGIQIQLNRADLRGADLSECGHFGNYTGPNLSGADLAGADLSGANLTQANLRGADLSGANLSGTHLSGANLSEAELNEAELSEADLAGANLSEAGLSEADLSGANLSGANLNTVQFSEADLRGANLRGADLRGANLRGANLRGANLSGTDLGTPYYSLAGPAYRAKFRGANLSGADLSGTNLSGANLGGTDLSGANLSGANLSKSNVLNANFTRANLTGACIQDWNINQRTLFGEEICDYIYYELGDGITYQERRPYDPNKIFNPGDLQRLIDTARETVDLIFRDGIDWKAFLESFHGLQIESENGELSIAGILKKRDGTFVIQIDAPQDTDKAELENRFYQVYEQKLALIEQHYQSQLANKEQEITNRDRELLQLYREKSTDMTEIAKLLANRSMTIEEMAVSIQQTGIFGMGVNQGEIKDNAKVAGILNEAEQQNLTEIITEVQAIIAPLAQTYRNNPTTQGIKAIEAIEKNPNLKKKLIEAAKKGSLEAFKKSLDNPVGAFIGGAIEGWMGK
jgi:uncharacterized protein YjbI with pentapeptide repeats